MKNSLLIALILCLLISCSKPEPCTPRSLEGTSTAIMNNTQWNGVTEALRTKPIAIQAYNLDDPFCMLDELYSIYIPETDGSFPFTTKSDSLESTAFIRYYIYDYDVPFAVYQLLTGKENGSITISFDTINERISGLFNVTLYLVQDDGGMLPDSLVIENGKFETGYKN